MGLRGSGHGGDNMFHIDLTHHQFEYRLVQFLILLLAIALFFFLYTPIVV